MCETIYLSIYLHTTCKNKLRVCTRRLGECAPAADNAEARAAAEKEPAEEKEARAKKRAAKKVPP